MDCSGIHEADSVPSVDRGQSGGRKGALVQSSLCLLGDVVVGRRDPGGEVRLGV